ncbi:ATP-binding protein [soil metagenome]
MSRLTIRAKLTLFSVIAVALVLIAAFFLTHWQVSRILEDANSSLASADLQSFAVDIKTNHGEHVDTPAPGVLVYVRDAAGAVQQNSFPDALSDRVGRISVASGASTVHADRVEYQLVGETVATPQGAWNLWSARSNASIPVAATRLDRVLALGLGTLLLVLALASFAVASAALRPVTRLREAAEQLALGPIGSAAAPQLPIGPARDEIASLAETLNGFLGDIHAASARERHMVSDAAHELRTPLAVLRTQLELAHDHAGDPAALEREIDRAENTVTRLSALASNLLELSRLEAGHTAPGSSTTEQLAEEILAGVDRARMMATSRHLEIGFRLDPATVDAEVSIDTVSFARVVDNLLANAIAAVEPGAGVIEVRLYSSGADTVMDVADNGHGMPDDFVPRAFDRFSRPDFGRTGRDGGAGLGLSLVQGIAHAAGGSASIVQQNPGVILRVSVPNIR